MCLLHCTLSSVHPPVLHPLLLVSVNVLQPPPTCTQTKLATSIRRVMVYAMLTIAFHMLMFFWHQPKGTMGKLYGLLPAAIVAALLLLMPVTGLMNMYYTQNAFTKQVGNSWTVIAVIASIFSKQVEK